MVEKKKKRTRVLILFNATGPTTLGQDYTEELKTKDWETERDILGALKKMGYPHEVLGIYDDVGIILEKVKQFQPDVIFNLVERFKNNTGLDQNIASLLELLGIPYTGCGPVGLTLSKNKGLSKKILSFHHIDVPKFAIMHRNKPIIHPSRLSYPIFIKPLKEEASFGIAQASHVENDQQFVERVRFIHEKMEQDAIAEEYIDGREFYVSILGNKRLRVFPIRELKFRQVPNAEPKFASYRAKWDEDYRKRWGIKNEFADNMPQGVPERIEKECKKIYKLLNIQGYARMDLRLTSEGRIYFIEANPNPMIAKEEDYAESALKGNMSYQKLIHHIIDLAKKVKRIS